MKKLLYFIRKEFIQLFRDRKMLPLIFIAPIIQLVMLGYAVTTDITHISLAVWDLDNSSYTRGLVSKVVNCGYFDYAGTVANEKDMADKLKRGKYDFILHFPPGFGKKLKRMEKADFQIIADGSDSNLTMIGLNYLTEIIQRENSSMQKKALERMSGILNRKASFPQAVPEIRVLYNQELKSSNYMVPGVICLILTITTMFLTSMAITKEKEFGTIEQLMVSPLKPYEIILGKAIPFIFVGMFEVVLVLTAGVLMFKIPIKGSVPFLFLASLFFVISALGIGIFISTISRTQQQAMMTSFIFIFPAMILSGFAFPISNMPLVMQYMSYLIPLRYFLIMVRGIILRGNGFAVLWPELTALLVFGVVIFAASAMRFRKKLG